MKTREEWNVDVQDLLDNMIDYMEHYGNSAAYGSGDLLETEEEDDNLDLEGDFDAYTRDDVENCEKILMHYLDLVLESPLPSAEEVLSLLEDTIDDLNVLNDRCGGQLIETDQREQICAILNGAAADAGCTTDENDGDLTYEWREW